MTVNRTTLLNLPLPVTGTESGTWGDTTNNGLTQYLDVAIAGMTSLTSSDFTAGALTLANTTGDSSATNIAASSAQYATIKVSSLATNSTITAPSSNRSYRIINSDSTYTLTIKASGQTGITFQPGQTGVVAFNGTDYDLVGTIGPTVPVARGGTGLSTTTAYGLIAAGTTATGNFQQVSGTGTSGQVLTSNGAGALPTWQNAVSLSGNNAFTGANTFYNATGQTFAQASTNDGIIVQGRAGGSSSYRVTFTTATLSSSTTLTLPNVTDTVATIGTAQTFTAAQTFRAASAVRSEAASTQDAVVLAGRAGGTSSYAVSLTPTTLTGNQTLTLPNASGTLVTSNSNSGSNIFLANTFGGF